jgi:hypothetical protein
VFLLSLYLQLLRACRRWPPAWRSCQ